MNTKSITLSLVALLFVSQSCGIARRNRLYDDFEKRAPKRIAMFLANKSILERSSMIQQFSVSSIFPDTLDKGSFWAFGRSSKEGDFLTDSQVNNIFISVLEQKGYEVENKSDFVSQRVNTISDIISNFKASTESNFDAALFVDYSDMYNTYFARKGVLNNPGHALQYRYALFNIETGRILLRYFDVVHPDSYYRAAYTEDDIVKEISGLLIKDLNENFPTLKRN